MDFHFSTLSIENISRFSLSEAIMVICWIRQRSIRSIDVTVFMSVRAMATYVMKRVGNRGTLWFCDDLDDV
jgi:hypothetical protein